VRDIREREYLKRLEFERENRIHSKECADAQANLSELEDRLDASKQYLPRSRVEFYLKELAVLSENYDLNPMSALRRSESLIRQLKFDVYYGQQDISRRQDAIRKKQEDDFYRAMFWFLR
jgi:hypothetical protein